MGGSGTWDPHAGLGAVGPEQGEGQRCGTGMVNVPDRCPRVRGEARSGDMVRDLPQCRNVRGAAAAGYVGEQLLTRSVPAELDKRRCGPMGHLDRCAMAARNGQCSRHNSRCQQGGDASHRVPQL